MKILCICHSAVLRVNRVLFEHLANLGLEVHLICPERWFLGYGEQKQFCERPQNNLVSLYPLKIKISGNGSLYFYSNGFSNLVKKIQPDYIYLDEEPWSLVALQVILAMKFKVRASPKLIFYTKQNLYKKYPFLFRQIQKLTFNFSDRAFVMSEEGREILIKQGYAKPITLFPHAVDLNIFKPEGEIQENLREEGIVNIGFFGRLNPEKGGKDLILAFQKIYSMNQKIKLFFVGGGIAEKEWKALVKNIQLEKAVRFLGSVSHELVPQYMRQMDIVSVPSKTTKRWKEQFGRVLIEAAACGAAVVGSNSGEIPNVMRTLGSSKQVFQEGDENDLAQKIYSLAIDSQERSQISKDQFDNLLNHFTYPILSKRFIENLSLEGI